MHSAVPVESFPGEWPAETPVQMHAMADDEWAEVPVMRQLAREIVEAELFLYPGSGHLFAESGAPEYDEVAAKLLVQHTLDFLRRIG